MTEKPADPALVLAGAMVDAAAPHGGLPDGLKDHAPEVAGALSAAIRANSKGVLSFALRSGWN